MTCQEVGEYVEKQQEAEKNKSIMDSVIGYRLAEMMIMANSMCVKRPKIMKYEELFKEFNIENNNSKEEEIQNKWREFLGVVK